MDLHGIFPPIPTPFTPEGSIDFDHLSENLSRWNSAPLSGYVVGGSNGEFVSLSPDERVQVVAAVREAAAAERLVIAGSGMHATAATIELTSRMAEAGADAALVVTPSYYKAKMDARTLAAHYRAIAEASPIPIILYNVPANTGINIPLAAVHELAEHPKIIAMKDSSGDIARMGAIIARAPASFQMLAGSGGFFLPALAVGAVGVIAALANFAAGPLAEIAASFEDGQMESARRRQLALIEVNTAVTSRYGVPGLKAALDALGYYGGPTRPPLLPLLDSELEDLHAVLHRAGFS